MVRKALIIAAGQGSRLRKNEKDAPKPLRKVAGLPLLERTIRTCKRAGISEFVIVVGFDKDRIINGVNAKRLGVKIDFVENTDWEKSNGLSVLAAKDHIHENFILLMSDHIFDQKVLEKLIETPLRDKTALLAVDYKIDSIFDIPDATKVVVENDQVKAIDKSLPEYNAIDTGMFLMSPEVFEALEAVKVNGDCALSDGIRNLAAEGTMGTFDIGDGTWQDVDTKPALKHAEKMLFDKCRKPTDGVISRHFNRKVSLLISRVLIKTGISANHATGFTSLVGILSGVFASLGGYWNVLIGAFLFKAASILDGVDGEVSKLKLSDSKAGQWFDTASDNFTYICFVIGIIVGLARTGDPLIGITGPVTLFGLGMTILMLVTYIVRNTSSGSLLAAQKDFQNAKGGKVKKFFSKIQFTIKRDFFALLFLFFAVIGQPTLIVWCCLIATNVTWMVLLNTMLRVPKPSVAPKQSPDAGV
jgi:choline kinase/phosphatidylglycerophosphate synthase